MVTCCGTKLIDPFVGELTGIGRYAVVAPPTLLQFPLTTLPEQAEGLRWLADIRQMASAPTVAALHREAAWEVTANLQARLSRTWRCQRGTKRR